MFAVKCPIVSLIVLNKKYMRLDTLSEVIVNIYTYKKFDLRLYE